MCVFDDLPCIIEPTGWFQMAPRAGEMGEAERDVEDAELRVNELSSWWCNPNYKGKRTVFGVLPSAHVLQIALPSSVKNTKDTDKLLAAEGLLAMGRAALLRKPEVVRDDEELGAETDDIATKDAGEPFCWNPNRFFTKASLSGFMDETQPPVPIPHIDLRRLVQRRRPKPQNAGPLTITSKPNASAGAGVQGSPAFNKDASNAAPRETDFLPVHEAPESPPESPVSEGESPAFPSGNGPQEPGPLSFQEDIFSNEEACGDAPDDPEPPAFQEGLVQRWRRYDDGSKGEQSKSHGRSVPPETPRKAKGVSQHETPMKKI
ncbi:hypothetical protein B0H34DRAFT_265326 [Crassisporium funariophilum]|nr:hypothetical protein B0H34DRAFT_265326 [Crassisporium funariophilum]